MANTKSKLSYECIYPESGNYTNVLVILHGYGAGAYDFLQITPFIKQELKNTLIIIPNAPYICGESGFKWFELETFDENYLIGEMEQNKHFLEDFMLYVTNKYCTSKGILSNNISLFGFSQGAIFALHYALQSSNAFNAVVAHSGPFVFTEGYKVKTKQNICLVSGALDHIVSVEMVKQGHNKLLELGISSDMYIINSLEHSVNPESIDYFLNFIKKSLT